MNCQSCNTIIEYRFLANCAQCGAEVGPAGLPAIPPDQDPLSAKPVGLALRCIRRVLNLMYLLVSAVAGLISGAVVVYFGAAVFFIILFSFIEPNPNPSARCALGSLIGFLSLYVGAFLGTVAGSAFAAKRPLFKTQSH